RIACAHPCSNIVLDTAGIEARRRRASHWLEGWFYLVVSLCSRFCSLARRVVARTACDCTSAAISPGSAGRNGWHRSCTYRYGADVLSATPSELSEEDNVDQPSPCLGARIVTAAIAGIRHVPVFFHHAGTLHGPYRASRAME